MNIAVSDPHSGQPLLAAGAPLSSAKRAVILVHGRGAGAADILGLAGRFDFPEVAYLAPQAANSVWYPHRFMEPTERNEPWLSSALAVLQRLVGELVEAGIEPERVLLLGFSQGACLASEYAARNPRRYMGIAALSGGLIGDRVDVDRTSGSLDGTPALFGCSDVDPHIPLARVKASAEVYRGLGAVVSERIYPGMGHTVNEDEIAWVRKLIGGPVA